VSQPSLFDRPSRCGYCERDLTPDPSHPGCFACPRCGPLLRALGADLEWDGVVLAFRAFQREAWQSRPKSRR
jgi:hypothetical protein